MRILKRTLIVIGIVQVLLGVVLLIPGLMAAAVDLPEAPDWVDWLLAMFGARALGFGAGMFVAARDPGQHGAWIMTMIGVQAIDWIATISYLMTGAVTLSQVTTAAFLPVVFIALLVREFLVRDVHETEPVGSLS